MVRTWIRWRLAETHGPQFELVRHFLHQEFATEFMSSELRRAVITVLSLLGCSGLIILRLYLPKYSYLAAQPTPDLYYSAVRADRIFFITVSMVVSGLVTLVLWQALFPGVSDYMVLKPLPVRLRQVFVARFLAACSVVAVVAADLNLLMSFGFPLLASIGRQQPSFGIRPVLAHASATIGGGLFVFLFLVALQGALLNLLSPRAWERVSLLMQLCLIVGIVAAGPHVLDLPNWHRTFAARPEWMVYFPPAWFLGWYESVLGTTDSYFVHLARIATSAVVLVSISVFATYFLSYWRHGIRVLEQNSHLRAARLLPTRLVVRVFEAFIPRAREQAVFGFAALTMRRSRPHKFVLGMGGCVATVLAVNTAGSIMVAHFRSTTAWQGWQVQAVLAVPLLMSVVVISALAYAFQIPAEVRANWVFRMAEGRQRTELLNAVESVLLFYGILPVVLLSVPIVAIGLGGRMALAHGCLVGALSLLLVEVRLSEWRKLPFTCAYVPGRRNAWQVASFYVLLLMVLTPAVTGIEAHLLRQPVAVLITSGTMALVYLRIRAARVAHWGTVPLLFDESEETLIRGLDLSR